LTEKRTLGHVFFGKVKSTIDFKEAMKNGTAILVNCGLNRLSKGEMIAVSILDRIYQAALEEEKRDEGENGKLQDSDC
jgi:hypothetical protein